jgi:hypothetical protein
VEAEVEQPMEEKVGMAEAPILETFKQQVEVEVLETG